VSSDSDSRRRQDFFPLLVDLFGDDELGTSRQGGCPILDAFVVDHLVARSALSDDTLFCNALYCRDAGKFGAVDGVLVARAYVGQGQELADCTIALQGIVSTYILHKSQSDRCLNIAT
jgi:hypothetical protein